jgi:hypothetical protein
VKARTAQGNQIRGLLAEFGSILPQGINNNGSSVTELGVCDIRRFLTMIFL